MAFSGDLNLFNEMVGDDELHSTFEPMVQDTRWQTSSNHKSRGNHICVENDSNHREPEAPLVSALARRARLMSSRASLTAFSVSRIILLPGFRKIYRECLQRTGAARGVVAQSLQVAPDRQPTLTRRRSCHPARPQCDSLDQQLGATIRPIAIETLLRRLSRPSWQRLSRYCPASSLAPEDDSSSRLSI